MRSACKPDTFSFLQAIREADARIAAVPLGEPFQLYQTLHEAARCILLVDAFYVCLFAPREQRLFFPYNFDGDLYDGPVNVPLGDGPTSTVILSGKPFLLTHDNRRVQDGGINFGDTERHSASAIHVPIVSSSESQILGVLSAQSYSPCAYDECSVEYLQWIADRAGAAMDRERSGNSQRVELEAAQELAAERWRQIIEMSDEFVRIVKGLSDQAEAIRISPSSETEPLKAAAQQLAQSCYRAQTEISMFPLTRKSPSSSPQSQSPSAIASLTEREREVLGLLALGRTNRQIADELYVSSDAVKFHCRNIFQKLNITSRQQTASIVAKINAHSPYPLA